MSSKFDQFWATVENRFPSDTSRYFSKPLLREAFNAGRDAGPKAKQTAMNAEDALHTLLHMPREERLKLLQKAMGL